MSLHRWLLVSLFVAALAVTAVLAQPPEERPPGEPRPDGAPGQPPGPGFGGPGFAGPGRGGPGGFGGFGGDRKLVSQFDKDNDGRLNTEERQAAREHLKTLPNNGRRGPGFGPGGPGGPGGFGPPGGGPGAGRDGEGPRPGGDAPPPRRGEGDEPRGDGPPAGPAGGPPGGPDAFGPPRGPGGPGGPGGGPPGFARNREPAKAGPKVSPNDVEPIADAGLYDAGVLRTLFFTFADDKWEDELDAFRNSDVEIPATLLVDGKSYPNVGVRFRGMSSLGMTPASYKRSLNVSLDFANPDQKLYCYKTLNLLNCANDPSFLRTVLYTQIAREYIAAPKANLVKVVINGESWGVYVNAQQFNKELTSESFGAGKGARWKVEGRPNGNGGLQYLGEDLAPYKQRYSIRTKDDEKSWQALVKLCKTLDETPLEELEAALEPMLDVDGVLWFLALETTLINEDGYWIRASDYNIYLDEKGKFHLLPHDANETFFVAGGPGGPGGPGGGRRGGRGPGGFGPGGFGPGGPEADGENRDRPRPEGDRPPRDGDRPRPEGDAPPRGELRDGERPGGDRPVGDRPRGDRPRGDRPVGDRPDGERPAGGPREETRPEDGRPSPGGPGGPGGGMRRGGGEGLALDPLVGLDDASKPLRSRLLKVPALRKRYLEHVRTIATDWLDWNKLGPVVDQYAKLIDAEVEADTRKLESYAAFQAAVSSEPTLNEPTPKEPATAPMQRRGAPSLKTFADERRKFLLNYDEIKKLAP